AACGAACAGGGADGPITGRAAACSGAGSGACGARACSCEGRADNAATRVAIVVAIVEPPYDRQAQIAQAPRQNAIATRARGRRLAGDRCSGGIDSLRSAGASIGARGRPSGAALAAWCVSPVSASSTLV